MLSVRRSEERGAANFGWLKSRHTFSFGEYSDPRHMGFSDLRVINDDRVAPGQGFGTHPHRDMEIFTYVLSGALEHRDSMGTGSVIRPGDVQMMSAGTGVRHSEFNPSRDEPVHFLQIWIVPRVLGAAPRYRQKVFDAAEKRGRLRLIVSPNEDQESLPVHQDARIYAGLFTGDESAVHAVATGRAAYVHVARGSVALNGQRLEAGDGAQVSDEAQLRLDQGRDGEVLLFDLRGGD